MSALIPVKTGCGVYWLFLEGSTRQCSTRGSHWAIGLSCPDPQMALNNCHVHTFSMDMIIIGHQNWRCPISFFLNSDVDCGIRGLVFLRLHRHHDANDGNWRARWACFLAELWWRLSTCTYIIYIWLYIHIISTYIVVYCVVSHDISF